MKVLLVEDEPRIADLVHRGLATEGWTIVLATDLETALKRLETTAFEVILLDLAVRGADPLATVESLREGGNTTPIIVLTALDEDEEQVVALRAAGADSLRKPFDFEILVSRLNDLSKDEESALA